MKKKNILKKINQKKLKLVVQNQCRKSKKNTIDPENIIINYGADAARLFILSDSPPEKDVQWSEEGIASSYKFIQKLWNLNLKFCEEIEKDHPKDTNDEIEKYTNKFLKDVTYNLENFSYNKIVANIHEIYSLLIKQLETKYKKKTLNDNYKKILIAISPLIPHFSNECMKSLGVKDIKWPSINEKILETEEINIVIQVNGKKRGLITTKMGISEEKLMELIKSDKSLNKHLEGALIKRKIYIKDKLINLII